MTAAPTHPGRLAELQPPSVMSDEQRRAIEANRAGFFEAVSGGVGRTLGLGLEYIYRQKAPFDPEFRLTEDFLKEVTEGLPESSWSRFAEAHSYEHAYLIREQIKDRFDAQQRLSQAGMGVKTAALVAGMADPAFLAAAAGASMIGGPLGAGAVIGGRVSVLRSMVQGGLIAAGGVAPVEAFNVTQDPTSTWHDAAYATLASLVLGGGVGAWAGTRLSKAAGQAAREMESGFVRHALGSVSGEEMRLLRNAEIKKLLGEKVITEDGAAAFSHTLKEYEKRSVIDELIEHAGLDHEIDADEIAELRAIKPDEALGRLYQRGPDPAGEQGGLFGDAVDDIGRGDPTPPDGGTGPSEPVPPKKLATDLDQSNLADTHALWPGVRFSMVGRLGGDNTTPLVRRVSQALAEDALPRVDDAGKLTPGIEAGSTWVNRATASDTARSQRSFNKGFAEWFQASGKPLYQRASARSQFSDEVGRAIRMADRSRVDPIIRGVAEHQVGLQNEILARAQRHGVKGALGVEPSNNYLARFWSVPLVDNATARFGSGLTDLFAGAIQKASADLTIEQATKVAKGFLKTIRDLKNYTDFDRARVFSTSDPTMLRTVLKDAVPDITEAQIEDILYGVAKGGSEKAATPRLRRRLQLDENYAAPLKDKATGDVHVITVADFLNNNAEAILHQYSRQMNGAAAEAEMFRVLRTGPEDSLSSWDELRGRLVAEQNATLAAKHVESNMAKLDVLWRNLRGLPLGSQSTLAKFGRNLRAFNYIRAGGSFGFAQIPEVTNVIAETGFKASLQQLPAAFDAFRKAASGRLANEFLDEIESFAAVATDRLNASVLTRINEHEALSEFAGGAAERLLRQGSHFVSDISGVAPITMFSQRWAFQSAVQKITNMGWAGRVPSEARLTSMNWTRADWDAIASQIKAHATTEPGALGRKVKQLNLEKWSDQHAAAKLITGVDKWSSRIIQKNDIGQLHQWMTGDMGRLVIQFRTFLITAYEKQFLHRVAMRDWQAFSSLAATTLAAGLVYMGQTYVQSLGRKDAEAFRKDRLSTSKIIRAAVQRGGWSSFIPAGIDNLNSMTGGSDPIFGFSRQTGLSASGLISNPTFDLFDATTRTIATGGRAVREQLGGQSDTFTQTDARNVAKLLPLQNLMGVKNMIDALITRLPKEEPKQ